MPRSTAKGHRPSAGEPMNALTLMAFAAVSFIGIATPGPTVLLALTNGSRFGVARSCFGMAGAVLSDFVLIGAVSLGLGALLAASEFWFGAVKWVGVCYLAFLGVMLLRSKGTLDASLDAATPGASGSPAASLLHSFLVAGPKHQHYHRFS